MGRDYVIGIDLGTTNSVVAYRAIEAENAQVEVLKIPQVTDSHTVESRPALPSFVYLGQSREITSKAFSLPWADSRSYAVGELARRQSADQPMRTVAAAKSWLCHSQVDRRQAILPPDAPADVERISPVVASQRYLEHLVAAWNTNFPQAPLADQQVVLTIPASFDAAARELTREAAAAAGLPGDFQLLEEPQAALYAWLAQRGDEWRDDLSVGDRVLVCDVGGGTTDLSLIDVTEEQGDLTLKRRAVGNHLLVGGDNMDLALAHQAAQLFADQGVELNAWQSISLWHACRDAKETLLGPDPPESHRISILGQGSRVIGGTVSIDLPREVATQLITDGFFPSCSLAESPQQNRASGFQELGLPYESDVGITRHLAAFVRAHIHPDASSKPSTDAPSSTETKYPSHILFNGGVFSADGLRQRVFDTVSHWTAEHQSVQELPGIRDLDCAVASGAAYYGYTNAAGGIRIRGGVARSYYIGIESAGLAIPGMPRPLRALCVVPFGMEEGSSIDVPSVDIGLVLGESVRFRFFSSSVRPNDRPGDLLSGIPAELEETDSLETTLPAEEEAESTHMPVRFQSHVTELGTLELWCVSTISDLRWKLEFSVRSGSD